MVNLAWGGYSNGQIPVDHLTEFMPGYRLESTAAAQFMRMRQACYDATGCWINPAPQYDIPSSYRDLSAQWAAWNLYQSGRGNIAAYPGGSNHGWARAIDLTGYENTSNGVWAWLQLHAAEFGYSNATGAATGTPPGERWHWECLTNPGTTIAGGNAKPLQEDEDDMKYELGSDTNQGIYVLGPQGVSAIPGGGIQLPLFQRLVAGDRHFTSAEWKAIDQTLNRRL